MVSVEHTVMHTESAILTLAQWLSPNFPVGSFAYSHGLEHAANQDRINDAASLETWLADILLLGSGRADALFLAASYQTPSLQGLKKIDMIARAFSASSERLHETAAQGEALCTALTIWDIHVEDLIYPVALGYAAARQGFPLRLTQALYLQAFLGSLVAAGQRLLPIGQKSGTRILKQLAPLCQEVAEETHSGDLSNLSSTTFLSDISSMKHEHQTFRIFRT